MQMIRHIYILRRFCIRNKKWTYLIIRNTYEIKAFSREKITITHLKCSVDLKRKSVFNIQREKNNIFI